MSDVYFTTNPSDYSKLPGLYISERGPSGLITGINLSTTGMAGRCVRGPDDPQLITNPGRFAEIFGTRDQGSGGAIVGQVWLGLLNKPFGPVVVQRVHASDAIKASFTFETAAGGGGTPVLRIDASSVGAWGNLVGASVVAATDGVATHFDVLVQYLGKTIRLPNININTASDDNTALVVGGDVARFVDLVKIASGRPVNNAASTDGADANGFVLLGQTVAGYTSVAGSEGTLAVTDYNNAVNTLAVFPDVSTVLVPEIVAGSSATYHSNLVTLAPQVSDRVFLTWAQVHGQSVSTEVTQVGTQITTRTDRIVWAYNSAYTIDPTTSQEVQTGPHVWLASILSQIDVDIHAGSFQTIALLSGITRVTATTLNRGDLIALENAGISTLERNKNGFQFRDALTTSLAPGRTQLARRRMADFYQLSVADGIRQYVKGKNTPTIRAEMAGAVTAFSVQLQRAERVVADFAIDSKSVNTPTQRARGEEHLFVQVDLIGHMLSVVLETQIETGLVIVHQ